MAERKTTKKLTSQKKKTTGKSTTSKSSNKRTTQKSTNSSSRTVSLRTDLNKFANEEYGTTELFRGAMIMVEREGADAIRAAATAMLAAKVPLVGPKLAEQAVDSLVRQLTDDYKKLSADDRKTLRGVLRWLKGDYELDTRTSTDLMRALSTQTPIVDLSASTTTASVAAPPPAAQLDALAQGFALPPKPGS
jgi:hypothetical protein